MALCYLGIGSNLGDRQQHLQDACSQLAQVPGLRLLRASPIYEAPAWGYDSALFYLNAVLEVDFQGSPWALLDHLLVLEQRGGRHARTRIPLLRGSSLEHLAQKLAGHLYQDRSIDIDILAFDGLLLQTPLLNIPHPEAARRAFVLAPWADLSPGHLLAGRPVSQWLSQVDPQERSLLTRLEQTLVV